MVSYEVAGEPVFMDCEKELVVFRIIQEAFNNIVKHSGASAVWLKLDYSNHFLDIMIRDNGIGFNRDEALAKKGNSNAGLNNMLKRAKLFGGHLLLESRPQRGTQILVSVPYY
jgi:signal transduction histidine kinase